jgi:hypothetical protein
MGYTLAAMDTESGALGLWSGVKWVKFTDVTERLVGPFICLQEVILLDAAQQSKGA